MTTRVITQTVREYLTEWKGKPIYRIPMLDHTGMDIGNNGDRLIELGGEQVFQELDLTFTDNPQQAELMLFRGNGAMLDYFVTAPRIFQEVWENYPNTPLGMLPATFHYPHRRFTEGFAQRKAPVTLFCRERTSYAHLLNDHDLPEVCAVGLGEDMAFELVDSLFLQPYLSGQKKHVLIVERGDREHPLRWEDFWTSDPSSGAPIRTVSSRLPYWLKKPLYPLKHLLQRNRPTPIRTACEQIIETDWPQLAGLPRIVQDVSNKRICSFERFCETIADAAVVFSTRLHVGILAVLLGKPTYVFEGAYHKIRSIYEHSMRDYDHLTYLDREQLLKRVA